MKATNIIRTLLGLAILVAAPCFARDSINCDNQALILSQDMTLDPYYHHNVVTMLSQGTHYTITEERDENYLTLIVNGYATFCREKNNRLFVFRDWQDHKHKFWVTGMMVSATPNPPVSANTHSNAIDPWRSETVTKDGKADKPNPLPDISGKQNSLPSPCPAHSEPVHIPDHSTAVNNGGGAYKIGPGITAPRALETPDPEYSCEARAAKYQGTVVLWLIVGADGRPYNIRVQRPLGMGLDQKAIEAVSRWRFEPAMKDGKPVAVQINIEVNFRLYWG